MKIWPTIADAVSNAAHTAQAPLVWDPANHLLSRFAFGPTVAARADVTALGWDGWYNDQLALGRKYRLYNAVPEINAMSATLRMTPFDLENYMNQRGKEFAWDAMNTLSELTLGLQTYSPAQLSETLIDFFSNHLNVANHFGDVWNSRPAYDREVIRGNAMGSYTTMLLAASKHNAMLSYLNLKDSTKYAINENYARELLELHTVGARYSENDVRNTARLLTGRTVDRYGHYTFDPYIHAIGPVSVLGFTHANASADGEVAGDELLRYLAKHPDTAQRLAQKLCVRFVSDNPSPELVTAVASAYLRSGTLIMAMVKTILCSDEFWASRGNKVRRPSENLVATVRILGVQVADWTKALVSMHWMAATLNNLPLDWQAPNGYPDVAVAWRSSGTLLNLWNYHLAFAGSWSGQGFGPTDLSMLYGGAQPATSGESIAVLAKQITGAPMSTAHLAALQTFLAEPADTVIARSKLRWLTPYVIGLILDGPHHALR